MKFKILFCALLLAAVFCSAGSALAMTEAERQALAAQIQQQINQLMAQVAQMLSQQQWCHTFNDNLGTANSGNEVQNLHIALMKEGLSYAPDSISSYSTGTVSAVAQFQAKYGINPQQGYTGPLTRTKLNQLYACSTTNPTGTCTPNWQYGSWSTCTNSQQTRTVTDYNSCGTTTNKPATTQYCSSTCTPNCSGRTCGDNGCGGTCGTCSSGYNCSSGSCVYGATSDSNCLANCINQADGVFAVNCYGTVTKCDPGEICQKTYDTDYTYNNSSIQTIRTLTGTECKTASSICTPDWNCSGFGSCTNGQQSQTCPDDNNCNATTNRPALTRSCSACTPDWRLGTWSSCSSGSQTRTVTDYYNCGITTNKPATTQSCTDTCTPDWQIGAWGDCINGYHMRTVVDSNDCDPEATTNRPSLTEFCTCVSIWQTGAWSSCANGQQTRTVADSNDCGVTTDKPVATQSCQSLAVSCVASPASALVGQQVTFTATVSGGMTTSSGAGYYTYSWSGVWSGNPPGNVATFTASTIGITAGTKTETVRVTSGAETATASCSVNLTQSSPLTASCVASPTTAARNQSVTFTATASGGNGSYTYAWIGGDCTNSMYSSCTTSFSTTGTKTAIVYVSSPGTAEKTVGCAVNVATATPTPVPSNPTVTVVSPNGGESIAHGSDLTIRWTSQAVDAVFIHVVYYNSSNAIDTTNPMNSCGGPAIPASNGSFTIAGGSLGSCGILPASTRIKIGIFKANASQSDPVVSDFSNGYFTITP